MPPAGNDRRIGWRSTRAGPVSLPTEDSPSGLGRTLGKRVGGNPSRVQISYPPRLPTWAHESPGCSAAGASSLCDSAQRRLRVPKMPRASSLVKLSTIFCAVLFDRMASRAEDGGAEVVVRAVVRDSLPAVRLVDGPGGAVSAGTAGAVAAVAAASDSARRRANIS